jgi:hypothetical protein
MLQGNIALCSSIYDQRVYDAATLLTSAAGTAVEVSTEGLKGFIGYVHNVSFEMSSPGRAGFL